MTDSTHKVHHKAEQPKPYTADDMSELIQPQLIELQAMVTATKRISVAYIDEGPGVSARKFEQYLISIEHLMEHAQIALDKAWKASDPVQEASA